jgi:hypothetical protein
MGWEYTGFMCKTIKQKVKFSAPPREVYRLLLKTQARPGLDSFPVDLNPGRWVVRAWREKGAAKGIFSMATIHLSEIRGGGTELVLTHRGVPKDLIPAVEREWRDQCWARMKRELAR